MSDKQYHYLDANRGQHGPVSEDELKQLARDGQITPQSLVWMSEWSDWRPAATLSDLFEDLPAQPPAMPSGAAQAAQAGSVASMPSGGMPAESDWQQPRSTWGGPALPSPNYTAKGFKSMFVWWLISFAVSAAVMMLVGILIAVGVVLEDEGQYRESEQVFIAAVVFAIPAALVGLGGYVLWAIMVYRWWRQIQDGFATTTAGKATGFQFIPIFSWYWWFIMVRKLPADLAAYGARHGITVTPASQGLATTAAVLFVVSGTVGSCVGAFSLPISLAFLVVLVICAWQFTRASMDIANHRRDGGVICPKCRYHLGGVTGRCPECGEPIGRGGQEMQNTLV